MVANHYSNHGSDWLHWLSTTGMEKVQKMKALKIVLLSTVPGLMLLAISLVMPVQMQPQPTQAQQSVCPAGSYNIGTKDGINPICKLEPTGCPYGDSIPLGPQCDKHKPVETPPVEQPNPAPAKVSECGGK